MVIKFEGIVKDAAMFQLDGMTKEEVVEMFSTDEYLKSALLYVAQQNIEDVLEEMNLLHRKYIEVKRIKQQLKKANVYLKKLLEG